MDDVKFEDYHVKLGACLYHIFTHKRKANGFNDSGFGKRRFDPIKDNKGNWIPTYYASYSDLIAFQETLIRKNSDGKHHLTWKKETVKQIAAGKHQCLAQITTERDLKLVDMETLTYENGSKNIRSLLRQGESSYPRLWNVAKYMLSNFPEYDGLIWDSYQRGDKGERAMVLWGNKVSSKTIKCQLEDPIDSVANLDRLRDAMRALNSNFPDWL